MDDCHDHHHSLRSIGFVSRFQAFQDGGLELVDVELGGVNIVSYASACQFGGDGGHLADQLLGLRHLRGMFAHGSIFW